MGANYKSPTVKLRSTTLIDRIYLIYTYTLQCIYVHIPTAQNQFRLLEATDRHVAVL